ncbi:MAG: DUF3572 domain-containing protein [Rhodobacteraceae bacterium]|nr:DUF3572 domain-containing protein [Paracoccaceae bacterium]
MLAWLAGDEEVIGAFLAAAGIAPDALAARAGDPAFLAAVVDFVLSEDAHVLAWAKATGRRPETALQIRAGLPGGDSWHWT